MPVFIESGFTGTTYPIANPRICAQPLAGTVSVSTEQAGFEGVNAQDNLTYTYWKASAFPANWQLTFATAQTVSYVGIAAHDLFTKGANVRIQKLVAAVWTDIMPVVTPTDNDTILFLFAPISVTEIRVRLTAGSAMPNIGIIFAGAAIELPQKATYAGSLPFNEALQTQYADTLSDGGHVLERFELRKAIPAQMTVAHLSESWAQTNVPILRAALAADPAFFADRPVDSPNSVVFGMLAEPLQPVRARAVAGAARDLTFKINGFAA